MAGIGTVLNVHARQFVLSQRVHMIKPDWQCLDIGHGWLLSHDPALSITRSGDDFILGQSIPVTGDNDLKWPDYLNRSGRFCVISYPFVLPDAAALLNLYFCRTGDGSPGIGGAGDDSFVTSSPAIAAQLGAQHAAVGTQHAAARPLVWGGMNWHPVPGPPLQVTRRLLRDQKLNLTTFATSHRPEAAVTPLADLPTATQTLCDALRTTVQALAQEGPLFLALTAGLDSRTLAAALLSSDVKFDCVTQNFAGVKKADITVAADICRYLGVKHHVIDPIATDNSAVGNSAAGHSAVDLWRQHALGSYSDADDNVLLNGDQYRFLRAGTILIRGGLFEVGRRFYAGQFRDLVGDTMTGEKIFRRFESAAPDDAAIQALDAWLDWRRANDNGLDLLDSFYLDQRVGGWLAAIEQALDLLPGRSVQPVNSLAAMRALVTPGIEDRQAGRLQKEAIARMAPQLRRFPLNPVPTFQRGKMFARRVVRSAKALVT